MVWLGYIRVVWLNKWWHYELGMQICDNGNRLWIPSKKFWFWIRTMSEIFLKLWQIHSRVSVSDKEQAVKQFQTLFGFKTKHVIMVTGFESPPRNFGFESEQCPKLFYRLFFVRSTHSWMNWPQFEKRLIHSMNSICVVFIKLFWISKQKISLAQHNPV